MNRCCRDAKNYLAEKNIVDKEEIERFIDKFNFEINNYSVNGISSYLLSSLELCIKLSDSIDYTKGYIVTNWIKAHTLFLGGYYQLADKSFSDAFKYVDSNDLEYYSICSSYALNLAYIGKFEESLNYVGILIKNNYPCWASYILLTIIKYRNEGILSGESSDFNNGEESISHKIDKIDNINSLTEVKSIFGCFYKYYIDDNQFFDSFKKSETVLEESRGGTFTSNDLLESIKIGLSNKNSFYHYIKGLLNIAEVYILKNDYDNGYKTLINIEAEKRDLIIFDCKLYKLLEKVSAALGNFKEAHIYLYKLDSIADSYTMLTIDEKLKETSELMYNTSGFVS